MKTRILHSIASIILFTIVCCNNSSAQEKDQKVRLARVTIDSTQVESYKVMLKEEIETSVRLEPGVLTLYAVSDKKNPNHITILEIYANEDAYKAHLLTTHFIKYKTGTSNMVKALELVETDPLIPEMKIK